MGLGYVFLQTRQYQVHRQVRVEVAEFDVAGVVLEVSHPFAVIPSVPPDLSKNRIGVS